MRFNLLLIGLIFLSISCKKNRDNMLDISGNVLNAMNQQPIEGIEVSLEVKDLGGSSFSNSFTQIETTFTGTYGDFEF